MLCCSFSCDSAFQGVKADDRKPYQRGVVDSVMQDLRALLNFRSSSEDEMKSRIAGLSSATISIDDEVVKVNSVRLRIFSCVSLSSAGNLGPKKYF
jgi:hypothetical protein